MTMYAIRDSAQYNASSAKGYVQVQTTCTRWFLELCISAGLYLSEVNRFTTVFMYCADRQEHSCEALCSANGICQIETAPQSIEATFTGRHETFQYTKVRAFVHQTTTRSH